MTDRWQNQRADRAAEQGSSAGSQFGWSAPTGTVASPSVSDQSDDRGDVAADPGSPAPGENPAFEPSTDELPDLNLKRVSPTSERHQTDAPAQQPPTASGSHQPQAEPSRKPASAPPVWPGHVRSGKDPVYGRLPHVAILAVAIAMVLGGGFWSSDREQSAVLPGGTDNIQFVSSAPFTEAEVDQQPVPNTRGLVASTGENVMGGYLSTSSLSVTPQQLGIETYVTRQGQTLSSVAADTGRSEETLLWANDYRDPSQTLPQGTQIRIPPTDGMLHIVSDGDTLENIAARYSVSPDAITSYEANGVEHSADLVPNRLIMVPGGSMPMRNEVIVYTVREGDQLWQIADRFGLRAQTILWSNSLTSSDEIAPGQQLAILPTDGVMVEVTPEDTIQSLAEEYGVNPSAIRDWPANGLGEAGSLMSGQSVMIPGGAPPGPQEPEPTPEPEPEPEPEDVEGPVVADADEEDEPDDFSTEPVGGSPPEPTEPSGASPYGTGEFEWPTSGVITQYFHSSHNGWDIANRPGTEIRAADNGRVIFSGWNNHGLGYAVAIDHGNGYQTWYGHMLEHPPVQVGQTVGRGEFIGPMGSTGFSTGPHVHFVIAYNGAYQDPGNYLQ